MKTPKTVSFRTTDYDAETYAIVAKRHGMNRSNWITDVLAQHVEKVTAAERRKYRNQYGKKDS